MNEPASRKTTVATDPSFGRRLLWFAVVGAVALLAYARSFGSPFQFDDFGHIVGNPILQSPTVESFLRFGRSRLLPFATLVLNYQLGGEDPRGYHALNFAVHLVATLAVFSLALALCRTPRLRETWLAKSPLPFAVAAAFLFACHPIQIQAVTYVVQRITSMAAMFYIASVLFYVRARNAQLGLGAGRPRLSYAAAGLSALCAFLSKENAASLPAALLLTEWTFYPGTRATRTLVRMLPFVVLVLVIPITWKVLGTRAGYAPAAADRSLLQQATDLVGMLVFRASWGGEVSPLEYLFTQCLVIPRYLRLVIVPWGFNVDHDVAVATRLSPSVLAGMSFLAALLALGFYGARRWGVPGFALLWLFVTLSVESSILPIHDVMVEHRMYLPMAGLALGAGFGFAALRARFATPARIVAIAAAGVLVALTVARNEVWRSQLSLWQDAVAKSPHKARPYLNVGATLALEGRTEEAVGFYCKALKIDPKQRQAKANLDRIMEMRADEALERGEFVAAVVGPHGGIRFEPPDPCAEKKSSPEQEE